MRILTGLLFSCYATFALAAPPDDWERIKDITPQRYVCGFASQPVEVDGKLTEETWKSAPWTADFVDIEGDRQPQPRFRTRAKMVWDQNYFYIAAELDEPHVWGTLTKHDSVIFQDNDFEVFIDPDGDNHEYYELELNALNTTWDLFLPRPYKDGGRADNGWEIAGLKTAVHIRGTLNEASDEDQGWSIEIAIPWKVLGEHAHRPAPPKHGDTWHVNFSRVEWEHEIADGKYRKVPNKKEDNWVWSPQGIIDMHRPERWGLVQFSQEPPGQTAFVPGTAEKVRDVLMGVYHAQKQHFKEHGEWAAGLRVLGLESSIPGVASPLELRSTKDGFEASLDHWRVRQDSRLWLETDTTLSTALEKAGSAASAAALAALGEFIAQPAEQRPAIDQQSFSQVALTKNDAAQAAKLLWQDHVARIRKTREAEMKARELTAGQFKMPFSYEIFGTKPTTGRSMYLSLHGGGGAPKEVNDRQWENQKRLYKLEEGIYVVPRAPTNTWDLWHQSHIDGLFARLIENLIVFEEVDPDKVYVMGYSAGGDGVYQLAPRMADRFAAAAMMAGHPNETSPLGLRNLPFSIHVGERDSAYNRNQIAREWGAKLDELQQADPDGYIHFVTLEAGKGHWMDRQDAVAIPWMAKYRRNPLPTKIVWKQDDVNHSRFYWLAVETSAMKDRAEIVARRDRQEIDLQSQDASRLTVRFNDEMLDLDQPVFITSGETVLFQGHVARTIGVLAKSLAERGDPKSLFSGEVAVDLGLGKLSHSQQSPLPRP